MSDYETDIEKRLNRHPVLKSSVESGLFSSKKISSKSRLLASFDRYFTMKSVGNHVK